MDDYTIRRATPADLDRIVRHRRRMFEAMGFTEPASLDAMSATSTPLIARGLQDGSYQGWLVESWSKEVVAGGGVIFLDFHSHPRDPSPRRAWVVNMYTEPEHRGRGLARRLMEAILAWCREQEMPTLYLHASDMGRSLYEDLGFMNTNEMVIVLKDSEI